MKKKTMSLAAVVAFVLGFALSGVMAAGPELVTIKLPLFEPSSAGGGDSGNALVTADGRYVLFNSSANNLVATSSNTPVLSQSPFSMNVYLRNRTNGTTTLVSVNPAGIGGNGDSICTGLSTNGRYALFESSASDLVPGDTNNATDVFVRDLVDGTTRLVSAGMNGNAANGNSHDSVMTPDGRYVAFVSAASNLVPNDTNDIPDVFVRDLISGTTTLASFGARKFPFAPWPSRSDSPEITSDGRFVVFLSTATNLVSDVTATNDVYLRDMVAGTTVAVSLGAHSFLTNSLVSYNHSISDDGRFVAFEANWAKPPGPGTNALWRMIFRYDALNDTLQVVSTNPVVGGPPDFQGLDLTPDGRFIAYVSEPETGSATTTSGVFLWDAQTDTTTLASADLNGQLVTNAECKLPIIDAGGQFISFLSTATNLTTNVVAGGGFHLFVRDVLNHTTKLVDAGTNGVGSAKDIWNSPVLTPNGRFVAFDCTDSDIVAGDNNRFCDVFLRDLMADTTELISVRDPGLPNLTPGGASGSSPIDSGRFSSPLFLYGRPNGLAPIGVSDDGRLIAFSSEAPDLVANDTNGLRDVFVRDLLLGTNILISVDTNGMSPRAGYSTLPAISADGRYVAFCSTADSLVTGDTNNCLDVFFRDRQTGLTKLVSVAPDGLTPGSDISQLWSMSADGRYVLFVSRATNLTANAFAANSDSLFWRDMQSGETTAITTNGFIVAAEMSRDGQVVVFYQSAGLVNFHVFEWTPNSVTLITNFEGAYPVLTFALSPDGRRMSFDNLETIYIRDLVAKTNVVVSQNPINGYTRINPQFSSDGRFLTYAVPFRNSPNDTNNFTDVYVFDFDSRTNELISRSFATGYAPNRKSDLPTISPDGHFVAYRSYAGNVVPGVTNTSGEIYLYDRTSGTTTIVGPSAISLGAANSRAQSPVFSGDSQNLVFRSWASDIVFFDFNQFADVFSWKLAATNAIPVFSGQMVYAPTSGKSPTLTWPVVSGKSYQVQFKNNLIDPVWQPLNGTVTVVGDRGYATDLAPSPDQRFYRILAY